MGTMKPTHVLENLSSLPPEAQKQVVDFIDFLRTRYKPALTQKTSKQAALENEAFVGMWCTRDDMKDSTRWVRQLRRQEWG